MSKDNLKIIISVDTSKFDKAFQKLDEKILAKYRIIEGNYKIVEQFRSLQGIGKD